MSESSSKKRKFLRPVGAVVAALLSVTSSLAAGQTNGISQANPSAITSQQSAKHQDIKPLLIKPAQNQKREKLAGHYSHSSHSSHSSHASHYSSSR